jgi:hypothetical protein
LRYLEALDGSPRTTLRLALLRLNELKLYGKAGGKTKPGLVNRRKAEAEMFLA